MKTLKTCLYIATYLAILTSSPCQSGDYIGAAEFLKQAAAKSASTPQTTNLVDVFRARLKTFGTESTNSAPEEAARRWLALVDEFSKVQAASLMAQRNGVFRPLDMSELLAVLPPPAAWPHLASEVQKRSFDTNDVQVLGLRLIAHALTGDTVKRTEDVKQLASLAAAKPSDSAYVFSSVMSELNAAVLATMTDPEAVLKWLETDLRSHGDYQSSLSVPNLVVLVGNDKAEAFLKKALLTKRQLEIEPSTATSKLARKMALQMINQIPNPKWDLINSLDCVELYEAMEKKFSTETTNSAPSQPVDDQFLAVSAASSYRMDSENGNRDTAKLYYFLGLIASGRVEDAIHVGTTFNRSRGVYFPPQVIKEMERAGLAQQLNDFFNKLLTSNPEAPFWDEYVQVAAHSGHASEALALVRATRTRSGLSKALKTNLRSLLPTSLLADDQVEEAVAEMRQCISSPDPAAQIGYYSSSSFDPSSAAFRLAQIGHLLDRKDWLEEGITNLNRLLTEPGSSSDSSTYIWMPYAQFLAEIGRGPDAEKILLAFIRKAASVNRAGFNRYDNYSFGDESPGSTASALGELVKIYFRAGKYNDVVALLNNAPNWGSKDLAAISGSAYYGHTVEAPLEYFAAAALAKSGNAEAADRILNYLLTQSPGLDRLYELLIELHPEDAIQRLDKLFARDRFEERPLIWKAHLLKAKGDLQGAETAARQAISIDPSDGEEGRGDRLRAYAELADIRQAAGDLKEADFLRGAVSAIRESERADELHAAGLLKRAVAMYKDSLTKFADAYCIQSRLAIQLSDLGQHKEAEEHYRRAYELMPDSFGRVESHCFGCERAFEGERAQSIAETVFERIAKQKPNKPQVYYLLGYLREEQDKPKDALQQYSKAVALDADYLNAWYKVFEISSKTVVQPSERDKAIFNLTRLDPRHRHVSYNFMMVTDLQALWKHVSESGGTKPPRPKSLYPLAASKRALEEKVSNLADNERSMRELQEAEMDQQDAPVSPGAAVGQNGFIKAGAQLVATKSQF